MFNFLRNFADVLGNSRFGFMGVLFCCIRPRVDEDDDFVPNEAIRTANNRSGDDSTSSLLRDISNRSDEVLPRGATDDKRLRSYSQVGTQPKPQAQQEPQSQPQQEHVLVSEPKQEQEPKPQEPKPQESKPQEQEPKPQEPKPQEQQEPQPQQQQERDLISEPKQEPESKPQEPKPQQQEQERILVSEPKQEQEPKSQEPKPQQLQEHVLVSEPKQEAILERHEPEQEPKQIQGLVLKRHNKEECFICFEVYTTEQPRTRFKCSHYCHLGCILAWQEISALCPMCLEVLELDDEEEKSPRTIISSTNQA